MAKSAGCECCGIVCEKLTKHHLMPRSEARQRLMYEPRETRAMALQAMLERYGVVWLCRRCHDIAHTRWSYRGVWVGEIVKDLFLERLKATLRYWIPPDRVLISRKERTI